MGFLNIVAPASVGMGALREAGAAFTVYRSMLVDAGSGEPCLLAALEPEHDWTRYGGWPMHWASLEGRLDKHRFFPLFQALSRAAGGRPVAVVETDDAVDMVTIAVFRDGALATFHSESDTPMWVSPAPPAVGPRLKESGDPQIIAADIPEASLRKNPSRRLPGWDRFLASATRAAAAWTREGEAPEKCPGLLSLAIEFLVSDEDFAEKLGAKGKGGKGATARKKAAPVTKARAGAKRAGAKKAAAKKR